MRAHSTLVVMRHGESTWTDPSVNRFAGWVDVPLTERGRAQAAHAGDLLKGAGLRPEACFTSLLRRSIVTADIVLDAAERLWVPVERTWRLNERHYGAFQGQTRPAMRERYGEELFSACRRGHDVRPPLISLDSPYYQGSDERYRPDGLDGTDPSQVCGESLADVEARVRPWWERCLLPRLSGSTTLLVVTHGSVARALRGMLEGLDAQSAARLDVPTGVPLTYELECDGEGGWRLIGPGTYLDPDAAKEGIRAARDLGRI